MNAFNGILLVDKPSGPTSHDVVLALRRALPGGVKVGHSGTLDPAANGLLILLVGGATKSAAAYQALPKVYGGRVRLGTETDTGDLDGKVVRVAAVPEVGAEGLRSAMASFLGTVEMPAPAFSAIKYKGKPLYAYARKGIPVPPRTRTSRVYAWDLLEWTPPELSFRLSCSHGTYARSLAMALGARLGCPAVLSALRREVVGPYAVADAMTLGDALRLPPARLAERLLPVSGLPPAATVPAGAADE